MGRKNNIQKGVKYGTDFYSSSGGLCYTLYVSIHCYFLLQLLYTPLRKVSLCAFYSIGTGIKRSIDPL